MKFVSALVLSSCLFLIWGVGEAFSQPTPTVRMLGSDTANGNRPTDKTNTRVGFSSSMSSSSVGQLSPADQARVDRNSFPTTGGTRAEDRVNNHKTTLNPGASTHATNPASMPPSGLGATTTTSHSDAGAARGVGSNGPGGR